MGHSTSPGGFKWLKKNALNVNCGKNMITTPNRFGVDSGAGTSIFAPAGKAISLHCRRRKKPNWPSGITSKNINKAVRAGFPGQ